MLGKLINDIPAYALVREIRTFLCLNSRLHNYILVLAVVTWGVMVADLQTELSQEREELEQVIAELSESRIQVEPATNNLDVPSFQGISYLLSDENFRSHIIVFERKCRAPPRIG